VGVVPCPFLGVGEDLVGCLDEGELLGRVLDVVYVAVGMEFEGFSSVCFSDPGRVTVKSRKPRGLVCWCTHSSSEAWRSIPSSS
jgi:hypothetical protein